MDWQKVYLEIDKYGAGMMMLVMILVSSVNSGKSGNRDKYLGQATRSKEES